MRQTVLIYLASIAVTVLAALAFFAAISQPNL